MRVSARKSRGNDERAREWGGLKADHVAPERGWISCECTEGGRTRVERRGGRGVATVSRIRMLRTPYNGHSGKLKPSYSTVQ